MNESQKLMKEYGNILDQLMKMNIIRTRNSPTGDYAEWLVSQKLDFKLENSSKKGYDATDKKGNKYQIKSRVLLKDNRANRLLGIIRNYDKKEFNYLIIVLFTIEYDVKEAYMIPHDTLINHCSYSNHQNGYVVYAYDSLLNNKDTVNITNKFL